jgi:hypothetical protein
MVILALDFTMSDSELRAQVKAANTRAANPSQGWGYGN